MMPHCKSDSQFELFETLPAAGHAPKLALPFQRSAEIDANRIAKVLDIHRSTALRMIKARLFRAYRAPGEKLLRIEYDSLVAYCNRLRLEYKISEKLLGPLTGRRRRDEDLLPFPMSETIGVAEVRETLDCTGEVVRHLLEEGALVGYQVQIGRSGCPWRIHRRSLERYVESLHREAEIAPSRQGSSSRL